MTNQRATRLTFLWASTALLLASCPSANEPEPVKYPPKTTLALTTPRCSASGTCRCRPLDSPDDQLEEGIPAGLKRYEFRLPKTTSALWVEVQGHGVYFKPGELLEPSCFYVDLPTGSTQIQVRGEERDPEVGLQTGLTVFEYGPKNGPHWYRLLDYTCGGMNRCTKQGMSSWVTFQRGLSHGTLDGCGSTQVQKVSVTGTRETRGDVEYKDMLLRFTLNVFHFETYREPGSPECRVIAK